MEVPVIEQFIKVFLAFLIIMDPFVSALYFLGISKTFSRKEKRDAVNLSSMIAGITLVIFLFGGPVMLDLLGISIPSFKIAGGLVLLIISIKFILGTATDQDQGKISKNAAIMILKAGLRPADDVSWGPRLSGDHLAVSDGGGYRSFSAERQGNGDRIQNHGIAPCRHCNPIYPKRDPDRRR
jgi:hypothetical protein